MAKIVQRVPIFPSPSFPFFYVTVVPLSKRNSGAELLSKIYPDFTSHSSRSFFGFGQRRMFNLSAFLNSKLGL